MKPEHPSRRRVPLLPFHAVALCLAIFLFATHYRMEQYIEQGLAFRVMSPAKLLTEKERPESARCRQSVLPPAPQRRAARRVLLLSMSSTGPSAPQPVAFTETSAPFTFPHCKSPQFVHFSFRPPPVIAAL